MIHSITFPAQDDATRHLPEGGLAGGAVHEMRGPPEAFAHITFVILLLAGQAGETPILQAGETPILQAGETPILQAGETPILWVSTVQNAYPPGIAWLGLDPGRILFAQAASDAECLGSLEVALRGGMTGIAEAGVVSRLAARRLSLAARAGGSIGFLLRHAAPRTAQDSTAFATRWFIAPVAGGMRAELLYAKGGRPGVFFYDMKEGDDAAPSALVAVSGSEPLRAAG